jgi:hypothetical protein
VRSFELPAELRAATPAWAIGAIAVGEVSGGKPSSWTSLPQIGNDDLRANAVGLLQGLGMASEGAQAPYELQLQLISLDQPMFLTRFSNVKVNIRFKLIRRSTAEVLLEQQVPGEINQAYREDVRSYLSSTNLSADSVDALRLFQGGAIKDSIVGFARLIQQLSPAPAAP